jgi:nicotinate-nucleotide--dimethylbenzimidazole phosphoribosyltransferase
MTDETPGVLLRDTLAAIEPTDNAAADAARERQARLTKPPGSMGYLEELSAQLCAIARECPAAVPEPATVAVFAADHGVHAQGVSPWPQEVTTQMVANFLGDGAVINAVARQVGAEVVVVNMGVVSEIDSAPGLLDRTVRRGTADMAVEPAMTRAEAEAAIEAGIALAYELIDGGTRCLIAGDMGIANTTASAALISTVTGAAPAEVTGRGTGIDDDTLRHKIEVIERALTLHRPTATDPLGALAAVGGLEHAGLVGMMLGAAARRTPLVLDGVISASAALIAARLAPDVTGYLIAGHQSVEPGAERALAHLGLRPLIALDLRLGEGSGATLALGLVQSAARILQDVATFDSAGVTNKQA